MRKIVIGLLGLVFAMPVLADASIEPLMNQVTVQLTAEQWVATKSALVSVGVNASVSDNGIEKVQSQVLDKLARLSNKGDWHLVSFERSQDKSGLERIQILAQARLPSSDLGGLRDKAKEVSKPGETYTIDNVEFTPSDDEIRDANNNLRANIYDQAKAELARLNKAYPEQKYYMHDVNFITGVFPVAAVPQMMYAKVAVDNGPASTAKLAVGDKLRMQATVILAAGPDPTLLKMMHG